MKPYLDLMRLWLREYFKHPVENIRQAYPIVPGRLYRNFGNICKAVPLTKDQLAVIEEQKKIRLEMVDDTVVDRVLAGAPSGITPEGALEMIRTSKDYKKVVNDLRSAIAQENLDIKCAFCDFHDKGIPCPLRNALADGTCVCDTHHYVIIKSAPHVY